MQWAKLLQNMKFLFVKLYLEGMSYYNISIHERFLHYCVEFLCKGFHFHPSTLAHSKLTIGLLRKVLPPFMLLSTMNLLYLYFYVFNYIIYINIYIYMTEFNIFAVI